MEWRARMPALQSALCVLCGEKNGAEAVHSKKINCTCEANVSLISFHRSAVERGKRRSASYKNCHVEERQRRDIFFALFYIGNSKNGKKSSLTTSAGMRNLCFFSFRLGVNSVISVASVVKKKRRQRGKRQNVRSEILSYHPFRVGSLFFFFYNHFTPLAFGYFFTTNRRVCKLFMLYR